MNALAPLATSTPKVIRSTSIEWTHHTRNFWWGCSKVSPACRNCYAEVLGRLFGKKHFGAPVLWGDSQPRVERLKQAREECLALNAKAAKTRLFEGEAWVHSGTTQITGKPESICVFASRASVPVTKRNASDMKEIPLAEWNALPAYRTLVFVNSMSDWLDDLVPIEWLAFLLATIYDCPHLTFQLLTKRPQNWSERLRQTLGPAGVGDVGKTENWLAGNPPPNVWIGTTVENQEWADKRIPHLVKIPAPVRFLSCEPLIGPLDLSAALNPAVEVGHFNGDTERLKEDAQFAGAMAAMFKAAARHIAGVHWVITGGESGGKAEPSDPAWFRSLRDQCAASDVPFFFKQWGEYLPTSHMEAAGATKRSYKGKRCRDSDSLMLRVGKDVAGNHLDGKQHLAFPVLAAA